MKKLITISKAVLLGSLLYLMNLTNLFALNDPPELFLPNNFSECENLHLLFEWNPPKGDLGFYRIQVSTEPSFSQPIIDSIGIDTNRLWLDLPELNKRYYWRVRARYYAPDDTVWSNTWTFWTHKEKPVLIKPSNFEFCLSKDNVVLQWNKSQPILWSTLEVSLYEDFHIILFTDSIHTSNQLVTYQLTTIMAERGLHLNYDSTYYWRVRDHCPLNWSAIWQFRIKPSPTDLIAPANGDKCLELAPSFDWINQTHANTYEIQISTNSKFTNVVYQKKNITGSAFNLQPGVLDYNAVYYWRIKSYFADGCEGDWSYAWWFKTKQDKPVLLEPPDNSTELDITDILLKFRSADKSDIPSFFRVEVAYDPEFRNPIAISPINVPGNGLNKFAQYLLTGTWSHSDRWNTKYFWRVKSFQLENEAFCESEYSETFVFRTKYERVELTGPYNYADCVPIDANFLWRRANDAEKYRFQLATDKQFRNTLVDGIIEGLSHKVSNLLSGYSTYYWRVRAEDQNNTSDWSDIYQFTTTFDKPQLKLPEDQTIGIGQEITLSWNSVGNGAVYFLEVSKSPYFTPENYIVENLELSSTSYSLKGLNYLTEYFWRVTARFQGCTSTSDMWTFRTKPTAPVLFTPENYAEKQPLTLDLIWSKVPQIGTYRLQVATDDKFTTGSIVRDIPDIYAVYYQIANLQPTKKYFWRANASSTFWGTSDWSTIWNFSTGIDDPGIPVLIAPENNSERNPINVLFKWKQTSGADAYQLQVSTTPQFGQKDIVFEKEDVYATEYLLAGVLENDMVYYWRVAAINEGGMSPYSAVWQFKTIPLVPQGKPILIAPSNGLTGLPSDITFSWRPLEGALYYDLQISKFPQFDGVPLVINDSLITDTRITIFGFQQGETYYWRVRGNNEAGKGALWSDVWKYTVGVSSVYDFKHSTFKLMAVPNPASYSAEIQFYLPEGCNVMLKIHDVLGRSIETLANGYYSTGSHSVNFNTTSLQAGIYWYSISAAGISETNKLIIVK